MALRVEITEHFQFLLSELLEELDRLNGKLQQMETRIAGKMMPYEDILGRLCTIPGIKRITAWTLVAEIGVDAAQFPDAAHLASWAGLCPGNSESAGKRQGARTRKGNRYLRRALAQTAWAISRRTDGGSLTAFFFRIVRRAGKKKAVMAVAHRVATIVYCMLRDGTMYRERICASNPEKKARSLVRRLQELGMEVQIRPRVSP
jgi:transposase